MVERLHIAGLFRWAAAIIAVAGIGLIASGGARGPMALAGFALFCAGMAALDGLYRDRFGLRQLAILLGWFAVGIGLWTLAAAALMRMLGMRLAPELRSLFILAAACAAGAAAGALLAITLRTRSGGVLRTKLVGFGRRVGSAVSRRDEPLRDSPSGAERPRRPAGPAPGG
jgi:hypothetical protein